MGIIAYIYLIVNLPTTASPFDAQEKRGAPLKTISVSVTVPWCSFTNSFAITSGSKLLPRAVGPFTVRSPTRTPLPAMSSAKVRAIERMADLPALNVPKPWPLGLSANPFPVKSMEPSPAARSAGTKRWAKCCAAPAFTRRLLANAAGSTSCVQVAGWEVYALNSTTLGSPPAQARMSRTAASMDSPSAPSAKKAFAVAPARLPLNCIIRYGHDWSCYFHLIQNPGNGLANSTSIETCWITLTER